MPGSGRGSLRAAPQTPGPLKGLRARRRATTTSFAAPAVPTGRGEWQHQKGAKGCWLSAGAGGGATPIAAPLLGRYLQLLLQLATLLTAALLGVPCWRHDWLVHTGAVT